MLKEVYRYRAPAPAAGPDGKLRAPSFPASSNRGSRGAERHPAGAGPRLPNRRRRPPPHSPTYGGSRPAGGATRGCHRLLESARYGHLRASGGTRTHDLLTSNRQKAGFVLAFARRILDPRVQKAVSFEIKSLCPALTVNSPIAHLQIRRNDVMLGPCEPDRF